MKRFLSILTLVLLMAAQMANATVIKTYADDKSGKFGLRCEYDTEKTGIKHTVFLETIYDAAYTSEMVFPEDLQATFLNYDGEGGTLDFNDWYYLDEYCNLDLVTYRTVIEKITINCIGKVPNQFAMNDPNFSHEEPTALKNVEIGQYITEIGDEAFAYNENLAILDGVVRLYNIKKFGYRAFAAAYEDNMMGERTWYGNLVNDGTGKIGFGSVTEIGAEAFIGQSHFKTVTFPSDPAHVVTISSDAFYNCGITELQVRCTLSGNGLSRSPFTGCPISKMYLYSHDGAVGRTLEVAPYMFAGIAHPFELQIMNGDKSAFDADLYESMLFYDHCFYGSGVKFSDSQASPNFDVLSPALPSLSIDEYAFALTPNMKSFLSFGKPKGDVEFWDYAFQYSGLEDLSLTAVEHVKRIGNYAFNGSKLKSLTIPVSTEPSTGDARNIKIGEYAFANTSYLTEVIQRGTIEYDLTPNTLAPYAFYRSGIESYEFQNAEVVLQTISESAFAGSKLKSFTAPASLAVIDHDAFASCEQLTKFDISKSQVSALSNNMLYEASALETLSLPEMMIAFGDYSLYGVGLKELNVNADILGASAFADCPNLETVRFTSQYAMYLPAYTISGLPKLKNIEFGKVNELQENFIVDCPALKKVVIPEGMQAIETGAFNRDNNVDIDTLVFASKNFKAIEDPNKAPFVGMDFALVVDKSVSKVEKNVFAIANITNSVELTDATSYDEFAFNMAQIDSLDWHYGSSMPNPFKKAAIQKLTFSKVKAVPNSLFDKGSLNNIYLDGIETIGDYAFRQAGVNNTKRSYTIYIPASVKSIGQSAFQDVYALNLVIEKGTGLTIGKSAFAMTSGAWMSLRSEYDKSNIPAAASDAFATGSKIGHVFTGGCDDVAAYKAAEGWKNISADKWEGATQYKYSFEVVGAAIDRDQSYYLQNMMLNGEKLPYTAISCSNTATMQFVSPCSAITLDHWADGTKDPMNYSFTLKSDTVIRIYVKEETQTLNLAVKDPTTADAVKFYIRTAGGKDSEWIEKSSALVNPCDGMNYDVKVELLDNSHYWFNNWVDDKDNVAATSNVITYVTAGQTLYANIGTMSYSLMVDLDPGCWDCYSQIKSLTYNGVADDDNSIYEYLPYNTEVTIGFVGEEGTGYRYILDYWQDEFGNIVSDENPYTFKIQDYTHFYPVIKSAGKYEVTATAKDDALGTVTMAPETGAEVSKGSGIFWEGSKIELQANPKNMHSFFKQWQDGNKDNPRQVVVKGNANYVAEFEKDSFNITIKVDGIPVELVEVKGAGRYGWDDEATLSYTLKNDNYQFENWLGETYSDNATFTFKVSKSSEVRLVFSPKNYTVTVVANPVAGGTIKGGGSVPYKSNLILTATANENYEFVSWEDDDKAAATRTVEILGDITYQANFKLVDHTITVKSADEKTGTVKGGGVFAHGATTTIEAEPKEHYKFARWNDDDTDNPRTITVTADATYTAKFEAVMFTIAANVNDEKMGSVSGAGSYQEGATVTLTATANEHYRFVEWSDGEKNATRSFTVTKDETYTAKFEAVMFTITANVNDEKMGSVSGSGDYQEGSKATLTATANDGYLFDKWDDEVTDATREVSVTENKTYTAIFKEAIVTYTITVLPEDEKMGTVSGSTTAIAGTQVKIEATPAEGYKFVQWNDGNTDNPRTITITGNAVYKAQFAKQDAKMFTITAVSADAEMGSVSGGGEYAENAVAELRAEPLSGYHFVEWKEDHDKTNPRKVTVTANATYTALFEKNAVEVEKYTITVVSDNEQMGTVYGGGEYEQGQVAELIALPKNENYRFVRWDDGTTTNPYYVTVTANATYKAFFEAVPEAEKEYFVSAISPDETKGKVLGSGFYKGGATATLIAIPEDGYKFVRWNDNSKVNPRDVVVDGNLLFVAQFESEQTGEKAQYTISISSSDPAMGEVEGGGEFTLDEGTVLVINAVAKTGYHFVRWEDNSTEMRRVITVNGNHNYIAFFEQNPPVTRKFIVNVLSANDAQGYTEGSGVYEEGQVIIIKAIARQGYEFKEWNDGNKEAIRMVTVTANAKYTASFQEKKEYFRLDVFSANEQQGSVIGSGIYEAGTTVSIAAIPEPGFVFAQWSDGSTENPRDVVVDKDILLIASFVDGSGVENIEAATESVRKVMIDGVIYIIKGDKKYNVLGAEVK